MTTSAERLLLLLLFGSIGHVLCGLLDNLLLSAAAADQNYSALHLDECNTVSQHTHLETPLTFESETTCSRVANRLVQPERVECLVMLQQPPLQPLQRPPAWHAYWARLRAPSRVSLREFQVAGDDDSLYKEEE